MPLPIVIIHGWSDTASSFFPLAQALAAKYGVPVTTINLAQWESMNDQVTYDDLVTQMDAEWTKYNLPRAPHSVDVIVHSTGGLLIRDWMVRCFALFGSGFGGGGLPDASGDISLGQAKVPPVKHLVMLAPANFGSPLAAKGTSMIGRVVKGWSQGEMLQVGALLLKG